MLLPLTPFKVNELVKSWAFKDMDSSTLLGESCCTMNVAILLDMLLILPTNGGSSVGIVRSRTQATEFIFIFYGSV
jgi:hypothetical protein